MTIRQFPPAVFLLLIFATAATADTIPLLIQEEVVQVGPNPQLAFLQFTASNPIENIPVIAFAVTVVTPDLFGQNPFVRTQRETWHAALLDRGLWDGTDPTLASDPGFVADGYEFGNLFENGEYLGRRFRTDQFGSFEEFFGGPGVDIQFAQVAFYFDNDGVANQLQPGETDSRFTYGFPRPDSITLTVFDTSEPTFAIGEATHGNIIPLPPAALTGLALLALLGAARRGRRPQAG